MVYRFGLHQLIGGKGVIESHQPDFALTGVKFRSSRNERLYIYKSGNAFCSDIVSDLLRGVSVVQAKNYY